MLGQLGLFKTFIFKNKSVHRNASGFVSRGNLLAIMGPSGSGKTTVLAAISRRLTGPPGLYEYLDTANCRSKPLIIKVTSYTNLFHTLFLREKVRGNVYVNGKCKTTDEILTLSGFVPQDDSMLPSLTVYEHFRITATLKMDRNVSEADRVKRISKLMQMAGIEKLSSCYIPDLSGGEKRRLSITVQMLSDPFLLFCDEPTSGLDSAHASVIIKMLKKFSSQGKIVVCSIHQPAASVYELFDRILLLASKGRTAYFGSVTLAADYFQRVIVPYKFNPEKCVEEERNDEERWLSFSCPPNKNIAEFLIDRVSLADLEADKLCLYYSGSAEKRVLEGEISDYIKENKDQMDSLSRKSFLPRKPKLQTQIFALLSRSYLSLRRNYADPVMLTVTLTFIYVVCTIFYREVALCSSNSTQNTEGLVYIFVAQTYYAFVYHHLAVVLDERQSAMREINNGLYSVEAYCITGLLKKIILTGWLSFLVILILKQFTLVFGHLSFWDLYVPITVEIIAASAFGCMLASAIDDMNTLLTVSSICTIITDLLGGRLVNLNSLPTVLWYLRYLSIIFYTMEYILVVHWRKALHLHIQCENDASNGPGPALKELTEIGYDVQYYRNDIWILVFFSVILFALSYVLLRKRSKEPVAY